ncbi:pentapeptide repeat-containing protein [Sphaerospermopsis sp. FACHB-1194]|uniref:pentapeptide repeat-containing protein n=1 Tax=Sphaerospermopsis sp. FACHB-1194 TaxID=2692862 RepID=UPI001681A46D|nr:pentapeptide repeat-containing protein [Sphaerospermopsis sp. FACHB-1194]MBD2146556.1 pentapeptide repeat-containing protein [Sphaerospermopsis sp. FACHB-1194]
MISSQVEMKDRELLKRYKKGERDFSNKELYAIYSTNSKRRSVKISTTNFSKKILTEINLSSSNLKGANFTGANLTGANFTGANLTGVDFTEANLSGANLTDACLDYALLKDAIFDEQTKIHEKYYLIWEIINNKAIGRNLFGVNLTNSRLDRANLAGVNLTNANFFSNANFFRFCTYGSSLVQVILSGANLENANLENADLRGANLNSANLNGTNLRDVWLDHANLSGTDLTNACLDGACLKYVILDEHTKINEKYYLIWEIINNKVIGRNLAGIDLKDANLAGACLDDANLTKANLENANFWRVDLRKAYLTGANLKGADLTKADLIGAIYNDETKFPEGFNPKTAQMIHEADIKIKKYHNSEWIELLTKKKVKTEKSPPPRPGQQEFKEKLKETYGYRCLISGCDIEQIIEAAHIIPYRDLNSHDVANGLLLRVDLHRLFDAHIIAIHPITREVLISEQIAKDYQDIRGIKIASCLTGEDATKQQDALRYHCEQCNWTDKQLLE